MKKLRSLIWLILLIDAVASMGTKLTAKDSLVTGEVLVDKASEEAVVLDKRMAR